MYGVFVYGSYQQTVVGLRPFYLETERVGSHRAEDATRSPLVWRLQDGLRLLYLRIVGL